MKANNLRMALHHGTQAFKLMLCMVARGQTTASVAAQMAACSSLAPYVRHVAQACQTTVPRPPSARREDWDRGGDPSSASGP